MSRIVFKDVAELASHVPSRDEHVVTENLGYLIAVLGRLFSRSMNARLAKHGISHGQFPVLLMLWADDGLSQNEICRRIAVEPATMVRTINRMERDGLVSRRRSSVDRRQTSIRLTSRGRSLRDKLVPSATEVNALAAAGMSRQDITALRAGLYKMVLSLREDQSRSEL